MAGLNEILIEGFNPELIAELEKENQQDKWNEIAKAQQTTRIVSGMLSGFETHKLGTTAILCGIVRFGDIKGLIPITESGIDPTDPQAINKYRALAGSDIQFVIQRYDQEAEIFLASRKLAREQTAYITLSKIDVGYKIYCVVREVEQGHLIGDIGGIDVHIPAFELSYGWIEDVRDKFKKGDHFKVQVTAIDVESKKVEVSAKPLLKNPFPDCLKRYVKGGEYIGTVSGVQPYGVFVALEEGVDTLAPHLKFQAVERGDKVLVRLAKVETKETKSKLHSKIIKVL